jgi:cell division protein FtsI (penicillin-binding protein 3)
MTTSRFRSGLAPVGRSPVGRSPVGRSPVGRSPVRRRPIRRRLLPAGLFQRRLSVLVLVYAVVITITVGQLVRVMVLDAADYAARGADQRERFLTLPADRGRMYDRTGEVLAASVSSVSVYADPRAFRPGSTPAGDPLPAGQDIDEALDVLVPALGVDRDTLAALLASDGDFVWLGRQLAASVGRTIIDSGLLGIGTRDEPRRTYPGDALGGQIIGITDIDGGGVAGLELLHDDLLTGQPGWVEFERDEYGVAIPSAAREVQSSVPGTDLVLTVDRQLQYTAERVAAEVVERYDALGASIVVLEVGTGDVLAMASAPFVNLNDREAVTSDMLRNRAVTDMFEPGSVQKALTAAAAIEEGIVTSETVLMVADTIEIGGKVFSDSHTHPTEPMSFSQVIEASSNVGTIMVAQELGDKRLEDWLHRFGYGQPLQVGFPGESPGLLRPSEEWWGTSNPTIAIGQGVAVTLLQAANAYATIANDGVAVRPRLVRGTVDDAGVLLPLSGVPGERVISQSTAQQVRGMLAEVVSGDRGTGDAAAVNGHAVAGKTGTARKPRSDGRGYSGKYVASFVGMAPADHPEVVVAVMVDEPTTIWGGVVAAPVFAQVMAEALRRQNVPSQAVGPSLQRAFADAELAAKEAAIRDAAVREASEDARRAAAAVRSSSERSTGTD